MPKDDGRKVLDPFLNLSLPSPALSLCFVGGRNGGKFGNHHHPLQTTLHDDAENDNDGDSDSDNDSSNSSEELTFRSTDLQSRSDAPSQARNHFKRQDLLKNRVLVSCHKNGEALVWDCARQTQTSTIHNNTSNNNNRHQGSGMAVKRIDTSSGEDAQFLYQTRDLKGTVAIHSLERAGASSVVREYETYSATFCQAAPCRGDSHLVALPSRQESTATVMDDRDPIPVYVTTTAGNGQHGMVTSLAMSMTGSGGRPILGCGMENGSVVFYDFVSGRPVKGECNLSKDPVLALDLAPSGPSSAIPSCTTSTASQTTNTYPSSSSSVMAIAGLAGDAVEMAELPEEERGRVALLRATTTTGYDSSSDNNNNNCGGNDHRHAVWNIRTRARLSTCRVDEETSSFGKPGVAICRFRPSDGRVFAVGGWDNRVRLFERSKGAPVGILRGHAGSVNALDWAPDAATSGLLATAGGEDGRISFWECFPSKS